MNEEERQALKNADEAMNEKEFGLCQAGLLPRAPAFPLVTTPWTQVLSTVHRVGSQSAPEVRDGGKYD
jgi:hypothetical protein